MVQAEALYYGFNTFKKIIQRKVPGRPFRVFNVHRYLLTKLIKNERLITTQSIAINLGKLTDYIVFSARNNDTSSIRRMLSDKYYTAKIIDDLVPRYKNIECGFTRIYRLPDAQFGRKRALIGLIGHPNQSLTTESYELHTPPSIKRSF